MSFITEFKKKSLRAKLKVRRSDLTTANRLRAVATIIEQHPEHHDQNHYALNPRAGGRG